MGEAYGTVAAIFLSAYLMFIMPLNNMIYESEKLEQMYVLNEITYFVESVRNTGCISDNMYLNLIEKLSAFGGYELKITHYRNVYNEDKKEVLYFEQADYLWNIKEELMENGLYKLGRNEYIKVMVTKGEDVIVCYGGSIKNENN